ncbi:dihydroorotase [Alkalicoccus luteus]|uniref:Dihydroorotase n=1 Tax=Alkalicoccus luteus TaxID=1237094 RepID=A0A969TTW3_9BACI|nr:dihydroorotase [Alkalicoccus luteus]NJP36427.1 dihydroorotase [Alkalicoccus luteus]
MKKLYKGARVYQNGKLIRQDLVVSEVTGLIEQMAVELSHDTADETIDVSGLIISPGFIDVHVHLREPGGEQKETISSGTKAAAKGGYTTVCAMPNTRPVPDTKEQMETLQAMIGRNAHVRVLPYGSITIREAGKDLTDAEALKQAGAFALTDDGVGVQSAGMMYRAMKQAAQAGIPVAAHCEDNSLLFGGHLHAGRKAEELNINGILSTTESVHIARDVLLAEETGAHYHVCHVSTEASVRVIRDAKKAGIHVTAEVSPHHLLLNEDDIPGDDAQFKMNPPLRSRRDQLALIEGLIDGTLDFIATDHAPHTEEEKAEPIQHAPFGITGLETAFPLLHTFFVKTKLFKLEELLAWMTDKPANVFNLPYGRLAPGEKAEFTVLNLEKQFKIDASSFVSRGKNTPFDGWETIGQPVMTIFNGKDVLKKEEVK